MEELLIDNIKVSVIIPTYGDPTFLEKSISSVINQSLKNIELIVVDDNNPNSQNRIKTERLVGKYLKKWEFKYLKHDVNKNGAAARNTGFVNSRGKYIAFLDSDDEFLPNRIEKCYNEMEKASENYAGVYSGCELKRNGKTYMVHKKNLSGEFLLETLACTFMFLTGSNLFVRRTVYLELGGFDESFLRHQDYEFLVRLFQKYKLIAIPEVLVIKNNENINRPSVYRMIEIKKQYLKKFKNIIDQFGDLEKKYIFYHNYIEIAEHALSSNKLNLADEFYCKAKALKPITLRHLIRKIMLKLRILLKK